MQDKYHRVQIDHRLHVLHEFVVFGFNGGTLAAKLQSYVMLKHAQMQLDALCNYDLHVSRIQ